MKLAERIPCLKLRVLYVDVDAGNVEPRRFTDERRRDINHELDRRVATRDQWAERAKHERRVDRAEREIVLKDLLIVAGHAVGKHMPHW